MHLLILKLRISKSVLSFRQCIFLKKYLLLLHLVLCSMWDLSLQTLYLWHRLNSCSSQT